MKRWLLMFALLSAPLSALAQSPQVTGAPPYSGNAIGTGLALTGPLFVTGSAPLSLNYPFSCSIWVKGTTIASAQHQLCSSGVYPNSGVFILTGGPDYNGYGNPSLQVLTNPGGATNSRCDNGGQRLCARSTLLSDGNWHHLCVSMSATQSTLYVDDVQRDQANTGTITTATNHYWQFGASGMSVREPALWNRALSAKECSDIYNRGQAGLSLYSGSLINGLVGYWPLGGAAPCTGSGSTTSCPDLSSNSNPMGYDSATPTAAVTAPSNGATGLTGSQTITATCSDPYAVTKVTFWVDSVQLATGKRSPYSTTWNTANYVDGPHAIIATCSNIGGVTGTSMTVTASTANGIAAKTVYLDPTSGTDCPTNNGLSSSTPCSTLAGVQSVVTASKLHGGDSILLKAGTNLNLADLMPPSVLTLCGPSSRSDNRNGTAYCRAQNTYPGQTITIGTYGGSGNCTILAGVTTDCASITLNANGTVPRNFFVLGAFNVPNMTIQNLRIFGSQTNAMNCHNASGDNGCGVGIKYASANSYVNWGTSPGTTIQNNEVVDFWAGMYISQTVDPGVVNWGSALCNVLVQHNYVHGASVTSQSVNGIFVEGSGGCGSGTSVTVTSNYTANQGSLGGTDPPAGIFFGIAYNIVDTNNAGTAVQSNMTTCAGGGGGYPNWWYQSQGLSISGNESWNSFPPIGGCLVDSGGFDLDNGTSQGVFEFNYAHESYGPMMGTFASPVHSFPMGAHTLAYNIIENGGFSGDGTGGMTGPGSSPNGPVSTFNNVIWNGQNGTKATGPFGSYGYTLNNYALSYGGNCAPANGHLFANNIVVASANSGYANMVSGGYNAVGQFCTTINYKNNDYYPLSGNAHFRAVVNGGTYNGVAAWNAASGDTGPTPGVNPNFASPGGAAARTCYGGGNPAAPTCVTNYALQTGSSLIGSGLNLTQASDPMTVPSTDYFGNAIPNGVGTGYNFGVDGAHH